MDRAYRGQVLMRLFRPRTALLLGRSASRSIVRRAQPRDTSSRVQQQRGGTDLMGIISWLVVGAIAGYLAGFLVKGDESMGVIGHIVLGIVGALVGGFLAGILLPGSGGNYI